MTVLNGFKVRHTYTESYEYGVIIVQWNTRNLSHSSHGVPFPNILWNPNYKDMIITGSTK